MTHHPSKPQTHTLVLLSLRQCTLMFLRALPFLGTWEGTEAPAWSLVSVWQPQSECMTVGLCEYLGCSSLHTGFAVQCTAPCYPRAHESLCPQLTISPGPFVTADHSVFLGIKHFLHLVSGMHAIQIFCQSHWPIFSVFFVGFSFSFWPLNLRMPQGLQDSVLGPFSSVYSHQDWYSYSVSRTFMLSVGALFTPKPDLSPQLWTPLSSSSASLITVEWYYHSPSC